MISFHQVLLIFLIILGTAISTLNGQSYPYTIERYDINYVIKEDGSVRVSEKLDCFFNEMRRGIIREIPLNSQAFEDAEKIKISDIVVHQDNFKVSRKASYLSIKIGDPDKRITGRKEYFIEYTIADIRQWSGEQYVFYHNLIGTNWSTDIRSGKITIELPGNLNLDKNGVSVYSGDKNSAENILKHSYTDNRIEIEVDKTLSPGQGVTLGFNYPQSYYDPLPPPQPWYLRQKWAAIPVTLFLFMYGLWLKIGSQNKTKSDHLIDHPPTGYSPTELGAFIDSRAQYRDFLALIAQWGDKEYLRIQHGEEDSFIVKLNDIAPDAPQYSKTFFEGLFQGKDLIALSELNFRAWTHTSRAQTELKDYMLDQKLYNPKSYFIFHSGFTIAMVLLLCGAIVLSLIYGQFISAALCAVLIVLLLLQFNNVPSLTSRGRDLMRHAMGYKNYIKSIMSGDNKAEDFKLDQMLPYMMIYDIDDNEIPEGFRNKLNGPKWFVSDTGEPYRYDVYRENWDKTQMKSIISTTPTSGAASSSSRSTFSGGSVGGGSGGGGGRSW